MPGPRQLRRPGQRVAGRHSPASHELGTRAPDSPDTVQHRRHPRPTHGSPRTPASQLSEWSPGPTPPLCALEELTSNAFRGLDCRAPQPSEGHVAPGALGPGQAGRRRRKSRTAFTAQQVLELERRFVFQKYLAPSERDRLAARLGLANAQVVTWFQNRRAKLKRDVEEMRADVASLRALSREAQGGFALLDGAPGLGTTAPDARAHLSEEEIQVDN